MIRTGPNGGKGAVEQIIWLEELNKSIKVEPLSVSAWHANKKGNLLMKVV